jgi:hypothetical protein
MGHDKTRCSHESSERNFRCESNVRNAPPPDITGEILPIVGGYSGGSAELAEPKRLASRRLFCEKIPPALVVGAAAEAANQVSDGERDGSSRVRALLDGCT